MPWDGRDIATLPGYWFLGSLGKRVLRPGGLRLTKQMLAALAIGPEDSVVEYAPGLGTTAALALEHRPASYLGIEKDERAARTLDRALRERGAYRCVAADAAGEAVEAAGAATVVYGESMLTIHKPEAKGRVLRNVRELLASGGRFGFQEVSILPDEIEPDLAETIRREVSAAVCHPVYPMSPGRWRREIEQAGFEIVDEFREPVLLLERDRIVEDEGAENAFHFLWNVLENETALRRLRTIQGVFRAYKDHLCGLSIVCRKA
jgi:SAM-dependent methyltransferase